MNTESAPPIGALKPILAEHLHQHGARISFLAQCKVGKRQFCLPTQWDKRGQMMRPFAPPYVAALLHIPTT